MNSSDLFLITRPHIEEFEVFLDFRTHASQMPKAAEKSRLKDVKILVCEDCPDLQMLYQDILQHEGALVDLASSGEEALQKAQAGDYHLLLMDVNMPKMNGIEATKRLRASGYTTPIIALTAEIFGTKADECKTAGYTANLYKPFYSEDLILTLGRILREHNS